MEPCIPTVKGDVIIPDQMIDGGPIIKERNGARAFIIPAKKIYRLAIFMALSFPARGTAISFLVERDVIFVATDGRATVHVSEGAPMGGAACKIYRIGNWIFAASGVAVNAAAKFNILQLARIGLAGERRVDIGMGALRGAVLKYIPAIASDSKRTDPKDFALWIAGKTPVTSIAIGSVENSIAKLLTCEFFLGENGSVAIPKCDTTQQANGADWYGMGANEITRSFLERNTREAAREIRSNPILFLRNAIEREIAGDHAAGGTDVGPPITTAKFDSSGLHFIEPGACPVDQPNSKK